MDFKLCGLKADSRDLSTYYLYRPDECRDQKRIKHTYVGCCINCSACKLQGASKFTSVKLRDQH